MNSPRLSVVIPCYNEEESLAETCRRVLAACQKVVGTSFEILFVNDGSIDDTWNLIKKEAANHESIIGVNLSRNHGHQLALSAGLSLCRGERVFIIDADLQDPPELLEQMMLRMDRGMDVIYGQRIIRKGETPFKKMTASFFYRILASLSEVKIPLDTGDFRLISRRALDVLNNMPEKHRFIRGMVSWIGFKQEALPYERESRFAGTTKYPLASMIRFALDAITGFSVRPLRLASYLGALFGVVGLCMLIYVLIAWGRGQTVQGWTSLAVIILILGSGQLFVLGVMGEYLGRLYVEAKHRPLFVIQDIVRKL